MANASLMAQVADLLGEELDRPDRAVRPPLAVVEKLVEPGEVLPARTDAGLDVAVYSTEDGEVYAVTDACPHDGGPLSSGFIEGGKLVCARHGWEFDTRSGRCPRRPASLCPRRLR